LAGLGININFGPVVDLASNPNNPIIAKHGRAFSANEDSVTLLAKEFIKEHHKMGVLTSVKHFPGHGSSKDDTHLGVADVTNTWEERELKPYQALIDSGYVDAVMTSHIVNKKLDRAGNPGTLSADILTGILRTKLKFNGVIFTDDMQMHAITENFGLEQSIKMAINGGVDIMTFSNNISGSEQRTVDKVHAIIKTLVTRGDVSEARIDESFRRIMKLKARLSEDGDEFYRQQFLKEAAEINVLRKENAELKNQLSIAEKDQEGSQKKKKKRKKR
jgi:beta-N-acetylhexosaminidase